MSLSRAAKVVSGSLNSGLLVASRERYGIGTQEEIGAGYGVPPLMTLTLTVASVFDEAALCAINRARLNASHNNVMDTYSQVLDTYLQDRTYLDIEVLDTYLLL